MAVTAEFKQNQVIPLVPAEEQKMPADAMPDLDAMMANMGLVLSHNATPRAAEEAREVCPTVYYNAYASDVKLGPLGVKGTINWKVPSLDLSGSFSTGWMLIRGDASRREFGRWAVVSWDQYDLIKGLKMSMRVKIGYDRYTRFGEKFPFIEGEHETGINGEGIDISRWPMCSN